MFDDVKFIYSEKATKFCEIFPLLLTQYVLQFSRQPQFHETESLVHFFDETSRDHETRIFKLFMTCFHEFRFYNFAKKFLFSLKDAAKCLSFFVNNVTNKLLVFLS